MSRLPALRLAALNIVLQPHTPERYVDLWQALFDLHKPVPIRGDQSLMLGRIEAIDSEDHTKGFIGLIFRFTTIDTNKPWFDIDDGKEADPAVVKREVKIPPHLCPNLATFAYRFFPHGHRLIIERQNESNDGLSPGAVEKLLTYLITVPEIAAKFENIDVTVEQEKETISQMLKLASLKELTITVKRPNPGDDDSDEDERIVFEDMQKERVRKKTVVLASTKNQSLAPSDHTKRLARVAKSNGRVEAIQEKTDGVRAKISSRDHPQIETARYNPKQQTRIDAFLAAARVFLTKITN